MRRSRLDREVRELLRNDPELLALAEVIASLRHREIAGPAGTGLRRRFRLASIGSRLLGAARRRF